MIYPVFGVSNGKGAWFKRGWRRVVTRRPLPPPGPGLPPLQPPPPRCATLPASTAPGARCGPGGAAGLRGVLAVGRGVGGGGGGHLGAACADNSVRPEPGSGSFGEQEAVQGWTVEAAALRRQTWTSEAEHRGVLQWVALVLAAASSSLLPGSES